MYWCIQHRYKHCKKKWLDLGADFIAFNTDTMLFAETCHNTIVELKS